MRLIGSLPHEAAARRFVDYLLTRRIAARADESSNGAWQIWVEDDDQLDAGRAELIAFAADPADAKFDSADQAATLRKAETKAAERRRRNFRDVRTTIFTSPNTAAVPVTMVIIGLCVALFVITHFTSLRPPKEDSQQETLSQRTERVLLFDDWTKQTEPGRWMMFNSVARGEVWRLFTPALLHGGFLHVLFNMMWMVDLGRRIEPVKGGGRFLLLILASALLSNLAQALWTVAVPWGDHYRLFLGMSGVVSALFGYAWMCGKFRPYERIFVTQHETGYMIGWLVICSFGLVGPIANAAHWGGLVVGMLLGIWPTWWRKIRG
ncbi:MAG: rhomboid family intramembrane serine protease [Tepidisphaeraceae bacterium]